MNPTYMLILGTGLAVAGAGGAALALVRPTPPALDKVLQQLNGDSSAVDTKPPTASLLPRFVTDHAKGYLGVSDEDMALLAIDRDQLATRKIIGALVGLSVLPFYNAILWAGGEATDWFVPGIIALLMAVLGWRYPSRSINARAEKAREQFNDALTTFTSLVALERISRGSPVEALEAASRVSQAWTFRLLHREIVRAELAGIPPWDALDALGRRVGVEELSNMARVVKSSADSGAAVFNSLLAESRSLRSAKLAEQHRQAGAVSEQLTIPVGLIAVAFLALYFVPALMAI
ncbi:type II secretion system F family protein [Janibacter melonis]|uniref:type II secretion system F family protein n=1 Tax=Janibacter melonis TaxID=262209 RepID=UPI002044CC74|nr:type II secretion system F family protein [Janibacter melonis]MCM3555911.1 type II secretion system F family protein [Janibacter melonis]